MAMPIGYVVTPGDTAVHNLLTLIFGADNTVVDFPASEVTISAPATNAGTVYLNSTNAVSSSNYSEALTAGSSHTYRSQNKTTANQFWLVLSNSADKLVFERII